MGGFHLTKIALACVGKYIKECGADSIFIESSVFGISTTESVLNGTHYYRSLKGMILLCESLRRLQFKEFLKAAQGENDFYGDFEYFKELRATILTTTRDNVKKSISQHLKDAPRSIEIFFAEFLRNRRIESDLFAIRLLGKCRSAVTVDCRNIYNT